MTGRQATRANDLALVVEAIADSIIEGALASWRDARLAPRLRDEIVGHAAELLLELTNGEVDAVAEALLGEDLNIQIECGPVTA
jgi:hypothetical protein